MAQDNGKNTYVIFNTHYRGVEPNAREFHGSYRDLLEHLNDIEPSMRNDMMPYNVFYDRDIWLKAAQTEFPDATRKLHPEEEPNEAFVLNGEIVADWYHGAGRFYKPMHAFSDSELEALFQTANGDGQPYRLVYCMDEHRVVIK